ncbi:MAG: hypothetical protein A2268_09555 [Candidatus Raymondbacteria bacterium RifOxyA12_full_50_37]|uniref:Glycolate oxidase iron-sulfur subunit n=1 Tax=Candidatus Raymondbacteria bacterium RIFOXYD12_FULL_49_13 TaxID=1817890 RepID=A0A1F7F1B6_UNCRA|nr:MAG: hypothetical protein A2268_09555 [Candidatus Raymondbacteria bacterium RifOxyA12_full_50_37]OGJ93135.1 MAG: hypothetical protein A2350_17745 [Candidatus Raymondbacteria bacterium RifOxyB12_full_50_8]OGJ93914.1 MAG: hypothetical protein A2248_06740 [Candidatus Raymondbacteria bacterium RIFOXYA2_FULL_49_16]OGJ98217.1 MAG: hypothetical protein A2453_00425 [Candidatus Raymondbacteria bacterium RIFOXYC2_FULL_50_21]OGK00450.1 MAG: hypothetical protein A2519_10600 [Candidatus Raymondbacteria b
MRESLIKQTNVCSKCGKCRSVCPTFAEENNELAVARGRIHLACASAMGDLPVSARLKTQITSCLVCMRCKEHCPNNIDIEDIIVEARRKIKDSLDDSYIESFIMKFLVSKRRPLFLAAKMMGLSTKAIRVSGLEGLYRNALALISVDKKRKLPSFQSKNFQTLFGGEHTAPGNTRKVLYFPGCSVTLSLLHLGSATIKALMRNNTTVTVPEIGCCGMPVYISGNIELAQKIALENIAILKERGCDTIVTSCGSCGHMLKNVYKKLLGDTVHSFRVLDISEYLAETGFVPGPAAVEKTVTYHDPCHLRRAMKVYEQPRMLLKSIPGINYVEMESPDTCCGSGGSFSLKYYDLSQKIREHKLHMFLRTKAGTLATGCPACIMHLDDGFYGQKISASIVHPIELLAKTYE